MDSLRSQMVGIDHLVGGDVNGSIIDILSQFPPKGTGMSRSRGQIPTVFGDKCRGIQDSEHGR